MLSFIWNHHDSFLCSNKNYTFSFFLSFFCVLMYISLYYNVLQNILSCLIIESKMQYVSLPKKYIYTKNQDIDLFTCIKYIIYITMWSHYREMSLGQLLIIIHYYSHSLLSKKEYDVEFSHALHGSATS